MSGGPADHPGRYESADPAALLPPGVPVRLVHGSADDRVPAQMSLGYARRAHAAGGQAFCTVLPGAGHFDVIDPLSPTWPQVLAAFRGVA
jgi:pimeloyl-ACP methyl ester carboxylesterase